MKRQIIEINEEKCDGCALCIPECQEGALQIIDGKVRLISDLFCDGLGACIGHCPQEAIKIIEREAEPYDEIKVIDVILTKPPAVLKAHLLHLLNHQAFELLEQALKYLDSKNITNPIIEEINNFEQNKDVPTEDKHNNDLRPSELKQWPVHLHLVSPNAPYFKDNELIIMSTCGPLSNANIHQDYIKNRSVVVACPKLDYTAPYAEKLGQIFSIANVTKVTVVIMEVPCCRGLSQLALEGRKLSKRNNLQIEEHILSVDGKVKSINIR